MTKWIKKLAASAAIAASLATGGLMTSGTANADTDTFLTHMHAMGYSSRMSDSALVKNGNAACELFDEGYSYSEVAGEIYQNITKLSYSDTYQFVGIAKATLCY